MAHIGPTAAGTLNAAVAHASAILARDPAAARREAEAILALAPRDPRALLILASARRRQGDAGAALTILAPLAEAFPRAVNTQYELGLALGALGRREEAIAALRRALAVNRDFAEAWRALGEALFAEGEAVAAEQAFAEHYRASLRDPALRPAATAFAEGRLEQAANLLRAHITARPNDAEALRLMAEVLVRLDRFADAEVVLAHALRLEPDHLGARFTYATALFRQQKAAEALSQLDRLLAVAPADAAHLNLLAGCLALTGDFERVIELYDDLLARFPRHPRIWLNQGHALRAVGRRADAVAAYRRSLDLAPGLGDAYWALANLKLADLTQGDEAAMAAQLARGDLSDEDRLNLLYALGKTLEDRGDYAGAFARYAEGAALRRPAVGYDAREQTDLTRRSRTLFTPDFLRARAGMGSPAPDPVFIVGLPRSGSTLIEQILASHSAVEGTMELPDIGVIATRLGEGASVSGAAGYLERLPGLDARSLGELGELYLERTRIQRKLGRPLFIDKMPNNFRHVGFIHLILPNAKIIDARRHPLASCFSAFKQHFAQGQGFSYDLGDLGRYYRDYVELMAHFDEVLPGRVHRVIYEDLVEDTEGEVRRLLDYCGLAFEPGCLEFHRNERAVRTVSSEQVRRPIFREGLEQWRHFEPWLDQLKEALGPALTGWRGAGGGC